MKKIIATMKDIWESDVQFVLNSKKKWGKIVISQMRICDNFFFYLRYFPTTEEKHIGMLAKLGEVYENLKTILQTKRVQFFDRPTLVEKT